MVVCREVGYERDGVTAFNKVRIKGYPSPAQSVQGERGESFSGPLWAPLASISGLDLRNHSHA